MSTISGGALGIALAGIGTLALGVPNEAAARLTLLAGQRWRPSEQAPTRESGPARFGLCSVASGRGPVVTVLALGLVAVTALFVGPLAALCASLAMIGAAYWVRSAALGRQSDRARAELTSAVAALSDEYLAGATIADAFEAAAAVAGRYQAQFAAAASTSSRSGDLRAALLIGHGQRAPAVGRLSLAAVAVAGQLTQSAGASFTAALAGVQADLAHDRELRAAVVRLLAAPRAAAMLLSGLPLVGVGLGAAMGARPVHVLFHTSWGALALLVGLAFELAGVWWTLTLTHRAQP